MLRRAVVAGLMVLLFAAWVFADERLDAKILYCGEPDSARAKDYCAFLECHFTGNVAVQDLRTFKEDQAKDCDVVIFDWSSTYDAGGEMNPDKWAMMRKLPHLTAEFKRPAILIGGAGGTVSAGLKLKINWLCLCLNGPAHHLRIDHPLFHTPLEVNPEFVEQPTPPEYVDETVDPALGPTIKVWQVQTKSYPGNDPGLVSTLYGFEDSPDAEVFAQGIAMKGPDTVSLGRHANYFLWGFSGPPSEMTPAAQRLFVNAVAYMRRFDGQSPLVRQTSSGREWALRYALAPRSFTAESRKRSEQQLRDSLPSFLRLLPQEARDNPEAFIAQRMKQSEEAELNWMKRMIPQPLFDRFGMDADKYLAYYRENSEYLHADPEELSRIVVDDDAKTVGPSNRRPEMLDRCVAMLENSDRPELATRLLTRYTSENFETAAQWRAWLDENRSRLFFSDVGGYKFFVRPTLPETTASRETKPTP